MSNVEVKEDYYYLWHAYIISTASFPSTLVPNTPPFVPVISDDLPRGSTIAAGKNKAYSRQRP